MLYARCSVSQNGLIHYSYRGGGAIGSLDDSYNNALAETINGLYKAGVIYWRLWKNREAMELATLAWVGWFNHRRLLEAIGKILSAEVETLCYRQLWVISSLSGPK